ncbi:acetyltransferase [Dictyobacter vulcani]|uniref:Acetyltransferase n=1 Tax=Dictyobacter vulcani TaxID=2607529 RepID=A0A5J4KLF3_9CHLR|nr:GNAT family N-acetyltransferase [Dictyobacter vulcani]GER87260.1 acetyltransferase [Dictyobacter vulcani]
MEIRPARKADSAMAIPLILQANGDIATTLTGSDQMPEILQIMTSFFEGEENRLSYQNTLVAEEDGHAVGILILYHGSQAAVLDRPLIERLRQLKQDPSLTLDKEADEDEWYIDTLSVSPTYAGRGIATALIEAAEERVRPADGEAKIALLVDKDNYRAYRLYQHLNYQQDKVVQIYQHPFLHMVKDLYK